jgi:hypothetical protein
MVFAVTFRYVSLQMDQAGFAIKHFDQQPGVKTLSGTKSLSLATQCLLLKYSATPLNLHKIDTAH